MKHTALYLIRLISSDIFTMIPHHMIDLIYKTVTNSNCIGVHTLIQSIAIKYHIFWQIHSTWHNFIILLYIFLNKKHLKKV